MSLAAATQKEAAARDAATPTPVEPVSPQQRMLIIECKPTDLQRAAEAPSERTGLAAQYPIIGVEHQQTQRVERRGDAQLDVRQPVQVVDAVLAEMIRTDVGYHGGRGMRDGDASA